MQTLLLIRELPHKPIETILKHPASSTTNLTGADFINIFGKKRKVVSRLQKKSEHSAQKIFEACFGIWQLAKSSSLSFV
jgi:hypothetical protein